MPDNLNPTLTTKTEKGLDACVAAAKKKLDELEERRGTDVGKNPKLDGLISCYETYIRRRLIDGFLL